MPRGATLHGRVTQAQRSGRAVGRSQLGIEFSDVMIDDQLIPIVTGALQAETQNEAGRTVGGSVGGSDRLDKTDAERDDGDRSTEHVPWARVPLPA